MLGYLYVKTWLALKSDTRGVTALEYGLIAAAIIAVIAGTVYGLGTKLSTALNTVNAAM